MSFASVVSRQARAIFVIVGLLCAAGLYAAWRLPISVFPQTDFPRIVIIVDNGEAPASQPLVSVMRPIEEAMNGIPGIARIKSKTARGSAEINLDFNWGGNINDELQLVQARMSQLLSTLPPTAEIRNIERLTFAVFPVTGYSLTSEKRDEATLTELATYIVRPQLARLPGVATVGVAGGKTREYHVTIDPEKLTAHNVSAQQVAEAIKNSNIIVSPGLIEENHQLELALISGQARRPEELNGIVVATVNNAPVLVSAVPTVTPGVEPQYTIVTADGHPAALVNINRQPDANTVAVVDEVKEALIAMRGQIPKDVRIAPYYDQSFLVRESINSVRDSILVGLLLSVVILYAFLRNWGTTFVAILVIPVTVLVTFLAMWLAGLSFDLMTLGGVAAAIGLVIDDAIAVVENIYTHMSSGQSRREAVQSAVSEITVPIIGSTITPVVVFLPLTLLTGVTGVFFRSLALTMSVALLTSLVLALTFTPVLAERFVRAKRRDDENEAEPSASAAQANKRRAAELAEEEAQGGSLLRAIIRRYEWVLGHALDNRALVLVLIVCVLAGSFVLYRALGSEFLPEFDESAFVLDYWAPPGSSLIETNRMLQHVEELLKATPEVESYSRRTGLELGLFITEPNRGDFAVKLKPGHKRETEEVMDDLRKQIEASEPRLEVEFVGILSDMVGDLTSSPEPIEIKLFREDTKALHEKADEVEAAIKRVPGHVVVDTKNGVVVSGPAVTFQIDPQRAARFGVTATDVANTVTTAMSGDAASSILQQDRLIAVRVIFPEDVRTSLDALRALQVRSATGALFRVDQVADIDYDKGQTEIAREGLRQTVAVTGRITGSDLGTVINQIKQQLAKDVKFPPGMTVEYGGNFTSLANC